MMAAGRNSKKPDGNVFRLGDPAEVRAAENGPARRCVVCRKSGPKSGMIRFVFRDEFPEAEIGGAERECKPRRVLRVDPVQAAIGRGAYCHRDPACSSSRNLIEQLVRSLVSAEARTTGARAPVIRPGSLAELFEAALAEVSADTAAGRQIEWLVKLYDRAASGRFVSRGAVSRGGAPQSREAGNLDSGVDAPKSADAASGRVSVPKLRL